ncbi:MAG: Uncharacterized protein G01um101444_134 [Parcubacteria group bacterium Gr01-1014_44]|nr:MAG: Uncharacterized protein G01um101444_134 [Parcubacteria group bacterium Gr01-1014_44]
MVYTNLKSTAIRLRKEGLSYSEIKTRVPVSKSTLSNWFKGVRLSMVQRLRLKQKRAEAAKRGSEKKVSQTRQTIEEIQKNSGQDIGKISKRELWLMGVMLYWKNQNKNDLKKGVSFTTSEPDLARLFLRWLREIGGLKKEEIGFNIFMSGDKKDEAISYWSEVTNFPREYFSRIYLYKKKAGRSILRIKVKASSMLARQISGWINGIKSY